MRLSRIIFSGLGAVALSAASSASSATSLLRAQSPVVSVRIPPAIAARHALRPRAGQPTPAPCASNFPVFSFVGVSQAANVAGGELSAAVGGFGNQACDESDGVAAGYFNDVGYGGQAPGSFIGGGYYNGITATGDFVGAGEENSVLSTDAFVGAGAFNGAAGAGSFVGAGGTAFAALVRSPLATDGNLAEGTDAFVGAGDLNQVDGQGSFIGAGGVQYALSGATTAGNFIQGTDSFIGAGDQNTVDASQAFLGGGLANHVGSLATFAVLSGGGANAVNGEYASVGGGYANSVQGADATIPGGVRNEAAGRLSFAAGYQAHAAHIGSFVWSDFVATAPPATDTGNNEFVVRASGGIYLYSSETSPYSGVRLPGGSGTWASLSDRASKTDVAPLDDRAVLAKVATLPISLWSYKTESGVRHVGPMAQDFFTAFGVGEDDRHITSIDEDGVALAAIKGLDEENAALRRRVTRDEARRVRDEELLKRDDARLAAVETELARVAKLK